MRKHYLAYAISIALVLVASIGVAQAQTSDAAAESGELPVEHCVALSEPVGEMDPARASELRPYGLPAQPALEMKITDVKCFDTQQEANDYQPGQ